MLPADRSTEQLGSFQAARQTPKPLHPPVSRCFCLSYLANPEKTRRYEAPQNSRYMNTSNTIESTCFANHNAIATQDFCFSYLRPGLAVCHVQKLGSAVKSYAARQYRTLCFDVDTSQRLPGEQLRLMQHCEDLHKHTLHQKNMKLQYRA